MPQKGTEPETEPRHYKYRYVPFITLSELKPRVWITLSDCNFRCRGCFSFAREPIGEPMTVEQLINLVKKSSSTYYGDTPLEEAVITGGEPTLNRGYLVELVSQLKGFIGDVVLDTNGYLLDLSLIHISEPTRRS